MRRSAVIATLAALMVAATGCESISTAAEERAAATALSAPTTSTSAAPAVPTSVPACDPQASLRPTGPLPAPAAMPAGTFMREIHERGAVRIGIDENTLYFSSRDAQGRIVGFEAEMAREIARAIFDDPEKVSFIALSTAEKVSAVKSGLVDATISVVSASCKRWQDVAFTTTYYETSQRVLVPRSAGIVSADDLADRRVCVTAGSSSEEFVKKSIPEATIVAVETRSECLVALQEGRADAIVLPNSILAGLHAQDSSTVILDEPLQPQYYAIPIASEHPEFVQFVNALFDQWRTDGTFARLQRDHLARVDDLSTDVVAPEATYLD